MWTAGVDASHLTWAISQLVPFPPNSALSCES